MTQVTATRENSYSNPEIIKSQLHISLERGVQRCSSFLSPSNKCRRAALCQQWVWCHGPCWAATWVFKACQHTWNQLIVHAVQANQNESLYTVSCWGINNFSKYFQNPFSSHHVGFERWQVAIGPDTISPVFFCCLRPRHSIVWWEWCLHTPVNQL